MDVAILENVRYEAKVGTFVLVEENSTVNVSQDLQAVVVDDFYAVQVVAWYLVGIQKEVGIKIFIEEVLSIFP